MNFGLGLEMPANDGMHYTSEAEPGVVERDPTGRYIRFDEVLSKGAFKTVYRAFDEVDILRSLKNENIIKLYNSWVDYKKKIVNMITELFTFGSLRGVKPASVSKVAEPQIKELIEKCLVRASERLSADPFLKVESPKEPLRLPLLLPNPISKAVSLPAPGPSSMDIDTDYKQFSISTCAGSNSESPLSLILELQRMHNNSIFRLKGKKENDSSYSKTEVTCYFTGRVRNIHFQFYLDSDTEDAAEMIEQLELADPDVAFIAEFIDSLIAKLLPGWKPSVYLSSGNASPCTKYSVSGNSKPSPPCSFLASDPALEVATGGVSSLKTSLNDCVIQAPNGSNNEYLSFLKDQESQASVISEISIEDASIKNAKPSEDTDSNINQIVKISTDECIPVNKFMKDSGLSFSNFNRELNFTYLPSSCSSQSIADKDLDIGLKLELDAVDAQYQQWFQELSRRRDEELEAAKKKWMAKKILAVK
ncbi:L-fucokinase/GDP-L-fucose pyrophosphorylase [Hibiscus syriacus]|uniref:non-specific serine/threonine protein kinase n=1 Tax=Hibiscus syriacus TaxID=106335 RepID=A0A6A2YZT3_HIBSY|nr:L-fucokinase/GDP-L-fucose pyrophosphorylase [Hibiscus syriacus]